MSTSGRHADEAFISPTTNEPFRAQAAARRRARSLRVPDLVVPAVMTIMRRSDEIQRSCNLESVMIYNDGHYSLLCFSGTLQFLWVNFAAKSWLPKQSYRAVSKIVKKLYNRGEDVALYKYKSIIISYFHPKRSTSFCFLLHEDTV